MRVAVGDKPFTHSGRGERGSATAETAVILPIVLMLIAGIVQVVVLGMGAIELSHSAQMSARAAARGESLPNTKFSTSISQGGGRACATAQGGFLLFGARLPITSVACAPLQK